MNVMRYCDFLFQEYHHFGDQILANCGFTMHDEFAGHFGAEPNTQELIKGRSQFDSQEKEKGRKMSSAQVQVEQRFGLLKKRFD